MALFVGACELLPGTRWVTNAVVRNAHASAQLYGELRRELAARAPQVYGSRSSRTAATSGAMPAWKARCWLWPLNAESARPRTAF